MAADLSKHHKPLTKLFKTPQTLEDWQQYWLTDEQIEFFHTNGYLAGVRVLDDQQLEVLRAELAELINPDHPGHDQLFCKPPHQGGVVAWHQDYSYWTRTQPLAHLSCWIGLDDSTRANGCLHYAPGSHRWNLLPITGLANDMPAIESVFTEEQRAAFKPVPIELKKGECSFHHPLMVHGSYANQSDRPRRGTVINVVRDGVCSASDEPLLEGVPPIPAGARIDGQFFPLLFDPLQNRER